MMDIDVRHLSASSVLLYSKCPYAFYLKNTLQDEAEETKSMLSGTIFHRIIELRLNGHTKAEAVGIATQEFMTKPSFTEALKEALDFYLSYEKTLEALLDEGIIATEKEFIIEVDGIMVKGYIDIITKERKMIDLKTTKYNRQLPDFKHIFQMSVYSLTDDADTYHLHYVFPERVEAVQVQLLPKGEVLSIIKSIARMIETNEFPALGLLTGYCSFCQYKKQCKYHSLTLKPSYGIMKNGGNKHE
jgi:CRISPR/Cas system-associated exonuclease Cas4 (RecB family)